MIFKNFCPVSSLMIDERRSRVNAALSLLVLVIYFYTLSFWWVLLLGIDFALRGFGRGAISPIAISAGWLVKIFHLQNGKINAGPKIFAARIGFVFCALVVLFLLLSLPITALIFAAILTFFAFLEAAFGFCMACYIYPYVLKIMRE